MDLIEKKTGKVVQVPEEQAQEAFQSGEYGFQKGQTVKIVTETGQVGSVPAEQAATAFDQGARLANPEEFASAARENKYGGVKGAAIAAGAGAARGLTLGISDPAIVYGTKLFAGNEAGEHVRETLKETKEQFPITSVTSEIGGALAPALLSGGGSAAATGVNVAREATTLGKLASGVRAVGIGPRAIAAAGEGVEHVLEHGIAKALGHGGESLLARIATKAVPLAAGSAVEGALFGATAAISEATLENEQLTAEKMLAAAGHGALIAGAVGGAIGTGSEVIKTALRGAENALAPVAKKMLGSDTLEGLSSGYAFKSLRASKPFWKKAEQIEGGVEGVGAYIRKEMPEVTGKKFAQLGAEDFAEGAQKLVQREGSKIDELVTRLDSSGHVPDINKIVEDAQAKIVKKLETTPGAKPIARAVNDYLGELQADLGTDPSFRKLWDARKFLDDKIYGETINPKVLTPGQKSLKEVRNLMETELTTGGEKAAATIGPDFSKEYAAAKLNYQKANVVAKATADRLSGDNANRFLSLGDRMTGASVGMGAIAAGHPAGLVGAAATSVASRYARLHGNQLVSEAFDKLSKMAAIQRMTGQLDAQVNKSLTHFFSKHIEETIGKISGSNAGEHAAEKAAPLRERYQSAVSAIAKVANSPETLAGSIAPHMEPFEKHAPGLTTSVVATAAKANSFLESKIPNSPSRGLFSEMQPKYASDADMSKFLRYRAAVDNPLQLVKDISSNKLNRETVEAVKTVYPELFKDIQMQVLDKISSLKEPPTYAKRLQLGILLDIPSDATLDRGFISQMQSSFTHGVPNQQPPKQQQAPAHPIHLANLVQTPFQQTLGRQ